MRAPTGYLALVAGLAARTTQADRVPSYALTERCASKAGFPALAQQRRAILVLQSGSTTQPSLQGD